MKFPKRLASEEGNAGEIARSILSDSEFGAPPSAAEHAVWTGLRAKLAAPVGASPAGFALAKLGVVAGIVAGAGFAALTLHTTPHAAIQRIAPPEPVTRIVQVDSVPTSQSLPALGSSAESPSSAESAAPAQGMPDHLEPPSNASRDRLTPAVDNDVVAKFNAAVGTARFSDDGTTSLPPPVPQERPANAGNVPSNTRETASQLLRETALLEQARAALRAGNTGQAWRTLERWGAEFPSGQLNQEREALSIELLWRSGRRDLASARIRAFVREYPKSAHAARLRALLSDE